MRDEAQISQTPVAGMPLAEARDSTITRGPECWHESVIMEARGLGYGVRGERLIDGIDLKIRARRRLLIMGANGAGKSVFLRLLHGLIEPDAGALLWRGSRAGRASFERQAMVFQRPVMLRRSVLSNLRFALSVRGIKGRLQRVRAEEALERARLAHRANTPARLLSGGEQQRLALARALACRPELLFLDEPTASLDPASTLAIEELLNTAHGEGVTIVMVTHDVGQARRLGDDVAFLHNGRLVETGPAERLLAHPQSGPARAWLEGRLFVEP